MKEMQRTRKLNMLKICLRDASQERNFLTLPSLNAKVKITSKVSFFFLKKKFKTKLINNETTNN